jgi:hypothetical protein
MLIFIAVICFIIAVAIGAWRQMCMVYELRMPFNNPLIWRHSRFVRVSTWIATAFFSIVFAYIIAMWISTSIGEFTGKFSFGVLLVTRMFASMFIGAFPAIKRCDKFEAKYASQSDD